MRLPRLRPQSGAITASTRVGEMAIRAVVTRADGTVVDYGIVSYYHPNPLRRWAWRAGRVLRGHIRG